MKPVTVNVRAQNMDPGLTPAQGRVAFHQERLLRSTGEDWRVSAEYRGRCLRDGIPEEIAKMTREQCRGALRNLEFACYSYPRFAAVRDCRTQWEGV